MLIFYLMYQKSNNYRNGSTKLAVFWAIGYLFLSAVKMLFNGVQKSKYPLFRRLRLLVYLKCPFYNKKM